MDIPYYERLEGIRKCFEETEAYFNFPKGHCPKVARAINLIMGFEFRQGLYLPTKEGHAWNYDPSLDVNVDLTLDQFNERHGRVTILSSKVKLWKHDWQSTLMLHQNPEAFDEVDGYLKPFFERYNQLYPL